MRFLNGIGLAGAALIALTQGAWGLEFNTKTAGSLTFVMVTGEFEANESLAGFTNAVSQSGAKYVTFDSSGGNVETAIELGQMIRAAGLNTFQLRFTECASACSLAFMGGVERMADPGSIGVHRASFSDEASMSAGDAVAGIQVLTAHIITYLTEMGVDPKLLAMALSYDRSDMRYLSSSEMAELHVITSEIERVLNAAGTAPATQEATQVHAAPPQAAQPQTTQPPVVEPEAAALAVVKELIEQQQPIEHMAIGQVVATYAPRVNYYGKMKDLTEIVADKRGYFQRWPERGYRIRDESVMVTCANDRCMVSGTYDWIVRNVVRNKQAKGAARFNYTLTSGAYPKVVAEGGEVIR